MKVCMLSYSDYQSDNRVRRYAESLVQRGDTVDVISIRFGNQPRTENILGVNVFRIQYRVRNESKNREYLFRLILFLVNSFFFLTFRHLFCRYDLIHVHSVPDFEVYAALVPRMLGAKIILDIHDIVPEFYAAKFNAGKSNLITRALSLIERSCCSFAHHVIISNDLWYETLISRSVNKSKCTVFLNYPDTSIFSRIEIEGEYKEGPFTIIYPGSLNYHQGVDISVKAMEKVRRAAPDVRFDIYGFGPMKSSLARMIQSLNLQETVFLYEPLSLEGIAKKMATAQLGIVPKRADNFGNQAFSTKILEFMILGVPVIASKTKVDMYYFNDSLLEFFDSGDENSLAQKIIYLYNNKQRRIELTNNAFQFATENSWINKKTKYFKMIDSLCG